MKKSLALVTCFILALVLAAPAMAQAPPAAAPAPPPPPLGVGDEIKDFTLKRFDGTDVSWSKDIKGKTKYVAVSFMNTACAGCVAEVKSLQALAAANPDLTVYAVMVDRRGDESGKAYKEAYQLTKVTFLLDPEFKVPPLYGFDFTPALLVAGKDGKIVVKKAGFKTSEGPAFMEDMKSKLK